MGNLLFTAMDMAQYASVYAIIVLLALLGVVLDVLFEALRCWLTHWDQTSAQALA